MTEEEKNMNDKVCEDLNDLMMERFKNRDRNNNDGNVSVK